MSLEEEWIECQHCGGSGRDWTQWDDCCVYCHGKGDVLCTDDTSGDDEEDYDDDE